MVENHILGLPKSAFYVYHHRRAILIGNAKYAKLRLIPGKEHFQDIPEAYEDLDVAEGGLLRVGFLPNKIEKVKDADFSTLQIMIQELTVEIMKRYKKTGERTYVFVYYAGHGNFTLTQKPC